MSERRRANRRNTNNGKNNKERNNPILGFLNVDKDQLRTMEIIGIIICIAVVISCGFLFSGKNIPDITKDGTIFDEADKSKLIKDNIYIDKTPLKGCSMAEAEQIISDRAAHTVGVFKLGYAIDDAEYIVAGEEIGVSTNADDIIKRLKTQGKDGADVTAGTEEEPVYIYELSLTATESIVSAKLKELTSEFNIQPIEAGVDVKKSDDENSLQVSGKVVYTESVDGRTVDADSLASDFMTAISKRDNGKTFMLNTTVVKPLRTSEELKSTFCKMASYTTSFVDSKPNRRYNVWKMASIVNGIVLQPGEEWSINDTAGPRNEKNGWKEATGITDGAYSEQYGGGICQVSSTLYNAVLRAELNVVKRSHHSWPVDYVPKGLDATISTGSPDFVFSNNYDVPIVVVVNCDAKDEKKVTVSIYGPERDYTVDFKSKIVEDSEPEQPAKMTLNPSLKPGEVVKIKERRNKIVAEVYKYKYDLDGNLIGEPELHHKDTYKAQIGEFEYGPEATTKPSSTPKPSNSDSDDKPTTKPTPPPTPSKAVEPDEDEGFG